MFTVQNRKRAVLLIIFDNHTYVHIHHTRTIIYADASPWVHAYFSEFCFFKRAFANDSQNALLFYFMLLRDTFHSPLRFRKAVKI